MGFQSRDHLPRDEARLRRRYLLRPQFINFSVAFVFGLFTIVNASVIALRRSRSHVSRPLQIPEGVRRVQLITVTGLIDNLMLILFIDGEDFPSSMVLLGIGLVAFVFGVKYECEAA
jgi:hypothetical protein